MDESVDETTPLLTRDVINAGTEEGSSEWKLRDIVSQVNQPGTETKLLDSKKEKKEEVFHICSLPGRSVMVLLLLSVGNFLAGCGFSLLAPFFPQEAARKHVSTTVTGLILSSFEFVIFLSSPVFGIYLTRIGPKFMFFSGIFVGGSCTILFGLLDMSPPGLPFTALCFACRSVEALALSSFITSSFAIVANELPSHVATVYGIMETASGLGLMVGPAVAGLLYQLGGYGLPFFAIGSLIILCGAISYKFLPEIHGIEAKRKGSVFGLLRTVIVWIGMQNIAVGALGITFLDLTLSPHLDLFHLSKPVIGLIFVIAPGLYAATAPVWGYLSDKKDVVAPLMVIGNLVCAISYLFIGTSPLLPFLPFELWVIIVGGILLGLSIGCALVPCMKCLVDGAVEVGFENNLDTFGIISGLFNSVFCLGAFTGPTLGGILVQTMTFSYTATVISAIHGFTMLVNLIFFLVRTWRKVSKVPVDPKRPETGTKTEEPVTIPAYDSREPSLDQRHSSGYQAYVRSLSPPACLSQ